jgi:hypothetical protein
MIAAIPVEVAPLITTHDFGKVKKYLLASVSISFSSSFARKPSYSEVRSDSVHQQKKKNPLLKNRQEGVSPAKRKLPLRRQQCETLLLERKIYLQVIVRLSKTCNCNSWSSERRIKSMGKNQLYTHRRTSNLNKNISNAKNNLNYPSGDTDKVPNRICNRDRNNSMKPHIHMSACIHRCTGIYYLSGPGIHK